MDEGGSPGKGSARKRPRRKEVGAGAPAASSSPLQHGSRGAQGQGATASGGSCHDITDRETSTRGKSGPEPQPRGTPLGLGTPGRGVLLGADKKSVPTTGEATGSAAQFREPLAV